MLRNLLEKASNALYDKATRLDKHLEEGIHNLPAGVKAVLVFILGGLAAEAESDNKPVLAYMLLGLGFVVAFGVLTLGGRGKDDKTKKPKRRI